MSNPAVDLYGTVNNIIERINKDSDAIAKDMVSVEEKIKRLKTDNDTLRIIVEGSIQRLNVQSDKLAEYERRLERLEHPQQVEQRAEPEKAEGHDEWLIWNIEDQAWFKTGRHGMTDNIKEAEHYTYKEAIEFLVVANTLTNKRLTMVKA